MQEQQTTAAATKPVLPETTMMVEEEEQEQYVKVASRFFRVKRSPRGGGGDVAGLHYLGSCFLCKTSIACDRDIFMYRDAAFCSVDCRDDQMDMDEALHAAARRHRLLQRSSPSSSSPAPEPAALRAPAMRRRPTIANLAARSAPVAAS
ncbi:hypothetical protein BS78_10G277300 [Paspalum vaginatum]|nr:hypothetical protein BS78_10G277300 [Paspalum vaginatum]